MSDKKIVQFDDEAMNSLYGVEFARIVGKKQPDWTDADGNPKDPQAFDNHGQYLQSLHEALHKPSLTEKLAQVRAKREALHKEARMRVAAAWTLAKTLIPNHKYFQREAALSFLQNSTEILTTMLSEIAKHTGNTNRLSEIRDIVECE